MTQRQGPVRARLETILERLHARRDRERTFMALYEQSAREEADAADARRATGTSRGALDGKIVSIKDLFDIAGEPTLAGSIIRRNAPVATKDAEIVRRLKAAGAVIIGKTHMTEFAFTAVGLNPHYPVPGNARDDRLIPGGSSSGAAVSVAEGTCDIAIGSDTGGSVRIPAALNGLVGFKPTARRIPLEGVFPLSPSLDSIGPLADSVDACTLADAIMAGESPRLPPPIPLPGLKIGIPRGRLLEALDDAAATAYDRTLRYLANAGCALVDIALDDLLEELAEATRIGSIAGIEASRIHADWLPLEDTPVDIRVGTTLRKRASVCVADQTALLAHRATLAVRMNERLSPLDALALPTTPIAAVPIEAVETDEDEYRRVEGLLLRYTQVANQFDLTAITLPVPGFFPPVGFMLMGANDSDRHLLGIARTIEALLSVARWNEL